ncbi:MAG TPA: ABC transporter ATP-binding protein, partial [Stellaceae bacterium]|nr:ABC transporter ATP-binding protein [Stellaceae bacterium]
WCRRAPPTRSSAGREPASSRSSSAARTCSTAWPRPPTRSRWAGCGKTTALRLVAGFLAPDGGAIRVGDRVLSSTAGVVPPERRNMSMIFQSYALWPHMTVTENVAYGLTLRKLPREVIARRVDDILGIAKIAGLAERYPGELSGGQQQRVALARALVVEPEILLLDEPLSNLDANLREEMRFEIRRLHDAYRYTTLYVTHDQAEAMTTADLIVVMNQGRIEQVGSPEDVYRRPRSEFVARFLGGTNILRGRRLGDGFADCGGVVVRCGEGDYGSGDKAIVSIRLHDIELSPGSTAPEAPNEASATVARRVYLGAQRDYLVTLKDGQQLRAVTPLSVDIPEGSAVRVRLPPARCRALPQ